MHDVLKTVKLVITLCPPFKKSLNRSCIRPTAYIPSGTLYTRHWNIKGKTLQNMTYQIYKLHQLHHEQVKIGLFITTTMYILFICTK